MSATCDCLVIHYRGSAGRRCTACGSEFVPRARAEEAKDRVAELEGSMLACEDKIETQRGLIFELREGVGDVDLWESLVARMKAAEAALAERDERIAALELLIEGKDGLLAAYRIGRPPSEKTWKQLEKAKAKLAALSPKEAPDA